MSSSSMTGVSLPLEAASNEFFESIRPIRFIAVIFAAMVWFFEQVADCDFLPKEGYGRGPSGTALLAALIEPACAVSPHAGDEPLAARGRWRAIATVVMGGGRLVAGYETGPARRL